MRMIPVSVLVLLSVAGVLTCDLKAQSPCETELRLRWADAHEHPTDDNKREFLRSMLTFQQGADCQSTLLLEAATPDRVLAARIAAIKASLQQTGSSAGSGNSTNLVSKGTTARILAVASEYGAFTETASGQTVTLQGQAGGIPAALVAAGALSDCTGIRRQTDQCISAGLLNRLNRFSYSIAFDASQKAQTLSGTSTGSSSAAAQPVNFTASAHTINSVTAKYVVLRGPSASVAEMENALNALAPKQAADRPMVSEAGARLKLFAADNQAAINQWTEDTLTFVQEAADEGQAALVWHSRGSALLVTMCQGSQDPQCRDNLLARVINYAVAVNSYHMNEQLFFDSLRKKPVLSVEYDYNRPVSAPTNSTFRLIYGQVLGSGWTLTANAAGSIYNSQPSTGIPGASLLRDIQVAGEASFDFSKAKKSAWLGNSAASGAYYFQDQTSPAILNVTPGQPVDGVSFTGLPSSATQVYAEKGKIHIVQGKFTFAPQGWNINIPLSVTWSNRTELVANANSIWRGQVGISYDFDSLFGSSKK